MSPTAGTDLAQAEARVEAHSASLRKELGEKRINLLRNLPLQKLQGLALKGKLEEIGKTGCLVSEMPPGFVPRGQDFPRCNRIISGIANAVIVIEAPGIGALEIRPFRR